MYDLTIQGDPNASSPLVGSGTAPGAFNIGPVQDAFYSNYTPGTQPPSVQGASTSTDWGSLWNTAWNTGYNQSGNTTNPYSGQSGGGYDIGAGYTQGQQQYLKDKPSGTTSSASTGGGMVLGASSGPSAEDRLRSEVASIFDPVFSALQGQEGTLNTNLGITNADITQQGETAQAGLAAQNQSGMQGLDTLGTEAGKTKEDAWTAARRLYDELSRGGQQRFGGSSSAGEAYGALTAVEQQRRQGTIQSAYEGAMNKVASFKNDLISKYQTGVKELESQVLSAKNQARQQFNDALQAIQSAKNQAQSDKASATLNTLQEYRNKVYTINLQGVQFAQTLAANKDITLKQVDQYTQQVMNSLTGGGTQVAQFGTNARQAAGSTTLGQGTTGTASTPTYQAGQMQSRQGQRWDPATQSWVAE
jgi:hypothetical protein